MLSGEPRSGGLVLADDEDEVTDEDREPGPEVTSKLFRRWQKAVRGRSPAEDMTNPVWRWLFRGRVDPYHANERFRSRLQKMLRRVDFPSEPRWAGCRMGQSRTELADGRVFWIAGEHEDFYDPDFFIYNDVIIESLDGDLRIFGYPESVFRPTDFHSATAVNGDQSILILGNVGYPDQREVGRTQIFRLDTPTLAMSEVHSTGQQPGWISDHQATLSDDGSSILVRGGKVLSDDGFLENIDDWALSVAELHWDRLTKRQWIRFQVARHDGSGLHLWNYDMRKFASEYPRAGFDAEDDLAEQIGAEPNMEAYDSLYQPQVPYTPIEADPKDDDDWRTKKITIDGVRVRYTDDMDHLTVTVEGDLPQAVVDSMAKDVRDKLSLVENADCRVKWIEGR
ncbi:hypothetical protein CKO51_13500 [Rhodopirellula sp. SM50]|nr:hypothetical protein CKO51_13500 [Rhodopirellula sp. SM50]